MALKIINETKNNEGSSQQKSAQEGSPPQVTDAANLEDCTLSVAAAPESGKLKSVR